MKTIAPFSHPMYIMAKAAGPSCNLACKYCYYTEKAKLYPNDPRHIMSDELLERFTKQYIEAQTMNEILFTWHGGEPLMRPIAFYERAIRLQHQYGRGRAIDNCFQTNGTLIDDKWADFFKRNNILVGVSIDGPQEFHDEYRRSRGGKPTFHQVMKGIEILNKHGVQWNAMAVVNDFNADYPLDFYHFFKEINCHYIQFTPIVERIVKHDDGRHLASLTDDILDVSDFSISPEQWGYFLNTIFDEWVHHDVGQTYVQLFDATLANYAGVQPGICSMSANCGHAGVMEYNGDIYCCDHFVFPEYKLGNIHEKTLTEMLYSKQQEAFGQSKRGSLPRQCQECKYTHLCHGECPKNRFCYTADGESGLNYLCEGYRSFFAHTAPYFEFMKQELDAGRAPANVMNQIF
jgi:uncharacterized protein